MMRALVIAAALAFAGCTVVYTPEPLQILDVAQYAGDVKFCADKGASYHPKFDGASVASSAATGAANNASGAVVGGWAVPVAGALGSASSTAITKLNIMGRASANVSRHCLYDKTAIDHSAILAKPED